MTAAVRVQCGACVGRGLSTGDAGGGRERTGPEIDLESANILLRRKLNTSTVTNELTFRPQSRTRRI